MQPSATHIFEIIFFLFVQILIKSVCGLLSDARARLRLMQYFAVYKTEHNLQKANKYP